jgi:hypothetical protein
MRKNIYVIGDLAVDHDVFARELEPTTESAEGERRFQVLRRQDTVGGAGNSARILAVLNEGATFLWDVVGGSHWGTFRRILSNSHAIDGASSFVELRGIQDEKDPRELCKLIDQAYAPAIKTHRKGEGTLTISHRHLDTLPRREGASDVVGGYFEFVRQPLL